MIKLTKLLNQNILPLSIRSISTTSAMRSSEEFHKKTAESDMKTIKDIETNLFGNDDKKIIKPTPIPQAPKVITKNHQKPKQIKIKSPLQVDEKLGLQYTKLHLNDPKLNSLLFTAKSRRRRTKNDQIIIEGRRLIEEAIQAGLKPQAIIFSKKEHLETIKENIPKLSDIQIYRVPQPDLTTWSTLTTCPGLIAIFKRPENIEQQKRPDVLPISVICDNIREPNNLGSIIRSCAAIPCDRVIVMKGCCDPWDTKSLRGGCGGQFYVNVVDDVVWENVDNCLPDNFKVLVADSKASAGSVCYTKAGVVGEQHTVLVIGGETHGISEEANRFLKENGSKGERLYIPLAPNVESLNTASALTVILFEIRNKILEICKK